MVEEERERVDHPSVTPEIVCTRGICAMSGSQSLCPPFFPTRKHISTTEQLKMGRLSVVYILGEV